MEIKSCISLFLNEIKMVGYTHIWHKDSFIYGKSNKQTTYKQKKKTGGRSNTGQNVFRTK